MAESTSSAKKRRNRFLLRTKEKLKMNQYWYSKPTLDKLVEVIEAEATRCAFLSTPSVYFSLNDDKLRENSMLFEYDDQWSKDPGFVFYDYKKPDDIPDDIRGTFDFVLIDAPFITDEVLRLYARAAALLLAPCDGLKLDVEASHENPPEEDEVLTELTDRNPIMNDESFANPSSKVLITTIPEHDWWLKDLLGAYPVRFQPLIPNLIYQYDIFVNFRTPRLDMVNEEIAVKGAGKKGYVHTTNG